MDQTLHHWSSLLRRTLLLLQQWGSFGFIKCRSLWILHPGLMSPLRGLYLLRLCVPILMSTLRGSL